MLSVSRLDVAYGDFQVIWDVSLEVAEGEVVALLGPNGAGKSTVINTISGLRRPKSGEIRFKGERIDGLPAHEIVRRRLSHILERRRVFPHLTVRQTLWLGGYNPTVRQGREETLTRVYAMFPRLEERADQYAHSLSGGEQQMLALGRGLMSQPELLMIDEPFLGLAPAVVEEMTRAIRDINQAGVTILFIEQNVQRALDLSHRGYILESGRLALAGAAHELLKSGEVKRIFLGA